MPEMEVQVQRVSDTLRRFVRPEQPVSPGRIPLSTIGQRVSRVFVTELSFFRLPDGASPRQIFDDFSWGLSKSLVQIPMFAGTVQNEDPSRHTLAIEIGQDPGVAFTLRDCSRHLPSFDDLEAENFPVWRIRGMSECLINNPTAVCRPGSPVMEAQLSIVDGGLILCTRTSHVGIDAMAFRKLAHIWGENTVNVAMGITKPVEPLPENLLDPWELSQGKPTSEPIKGYRMLSELKSTARVGESGSSTTNRAGCALFSADVTKLAELKAMIQSSNPDIWSADRRNNPKISAADCLTSLLWRSFAQAKREVAGIGAEQGEVLGMAGDLRGTLKSSLPSEYLGAAVCMHRVAAEPSTVSDRTIKGLGRLACGLRETIDNFDVDRYRKVIHVANTSPSVFSIIPEPVGFFLTNQSRVNIFVDRHPVLGKAVAYRQPYAAAELPTNPECIMLPQRPGSQFIDFTITSDESILRRMKQNPLFSRFVDCRWSMTDTIKARL